MQDVFPISYRYPNFHQILIVGKSPTCPCGISLHILKISLEYSSFKKMLGYPHWSATDLMAFLIRRQYPQDIPIFWDVRDQYEIFWGYLVLCEMFQFHYNFYHQLFPSAFHSMALMLWKDVREVHSIIVMPLFHLLISWFLIMKHVFHLVNY